MFTVYENSEDIAMTSNMDNVYSNAEHKDQNKEERGYKVTLLIAHIYFQNKATILFIQMQECSVSNSVSL